MNRAAAVLELLRRHRDQWLSMAALQAALGVQPIEVHGAIDALRAMGHQVETTPVDGFRWCGPGPRLNADVVQCGLQTRRLGRQVLVFESTDSTNDVAWHYLAAADYDGLAVLAEQQRAGRGRLGRRWVAPPGSSLLLSVLLQDCRGVSGAALTLLAGVAAATAAAHGTQLRCRIKWPNDVIVNGRKLAGVMIESRQHAGRTAAVIGIGVNCTQQPLDFPAELRARATSLAQEAGGPIDRVRLVQTLLEQLEWWLDRVEAGQLDLLHREWLASCDDLGHRLAVWYDGRRYQGRVIDVSPEHGLVMQLDAGAVRVFDPALTSVDK